MTPKISVSPAAMRNSITPSCSPLSICSMKSAICTRRTQASGVARIIRARASWCAPRRSMTVTNLPPLHEGEAGAFMRGLFQRALLGIGIAMVGKGRGDDLVGQHVAFLHHLTDIDVLDRVIVGVEGELAAHRLEIGGLERGTERSRVLDAGLVGSGDDQAAGVIGLCGIDR